jgi:hypothetical protein
MLFALTHLHVFCLTAIDSICVFPSFVDDTNIFGLALDVVLAFL